MSDPPLSVVIAGAGVAGLEILMALRELAGDRVRLTLVAPDDEFVFRPLAADDSHSVGRMRRAALGDAAEHAAAHFVPSTIEAVDPHGRIVTVTEHHPIEYDALVLAVGAEPMPIVPHALTWDDRSDAELLGGLLRDIDEGYVRRVAVVIPTGPGWPLRGYELALIIARQAQDAAGHVAEVTIVAPEPPPLSVLGSEVVDVVSNELQRAGITVRPAAHVDVERGRTAVLALQPSGERIDVDRVVALPTLKGRRIAGVDADPDGFLAVDERCRVRGVDGLWAAGDATDFPLKSGGFAVEQGDVVACDIAAFAGAAVECSGFDPLRRKDLAGMPAGRFLTKWLAAGDDALMTHIPTEAGIAVLTYLQRDLAAGWRPYG